MQYGQARVLGLLAAAGLACAGSNPIDVLAPDAAAGADALPLGPEASASDLVPATDVVVPPGPGGSDGGVISACATPLSAPLRRLTTAQYLRTVRELTGVTVTTEFLPESSFDGFDDRADQQSVDALRVQAWSKAADEVVTALQFRLPVLAGCAGPIDAACARAFIETFGRRAHRRPLEVAEIDAYFALFTRVSALGDGKDGASAVLRAMLQSPHLLYRLELGGSAAGDRVAPSPWEVAARLSYFLWGNMPDATLVSAAEAGELATAQQVSAQARRMLLDQRARQGANDFFRQWLGLDRVLEARKDLALVPDWDSALAPALREEGYRFTQRVLFDSDGKFASLFTAPEATVNGRLAQLYGLTVMGTDWQQVSLTGQPRLGLLTQGWFLATQASNTDSNPTRRGAFVRSRLLCQPVPPEPPSVPAMPPPANLPATTRERFQVHISNPACAACHALMDPIGFPFEGYDGIGAFRRTENGKPVDTSGELTGTDSDGPLADALALGRRLATSNQARACFGRRWYELAVGHEAGEVDQCRTGELERAFRASDGNMRQLLVDVATLAALAPRPASEVASPRLTQPLLVNPVEERRMVLDLLGSQVAALRGRLVLPQDRERLDQHLEGLRELEKQLR